MGFKYSYNIEKAIREVHGATHDATDSNNDGFIMWGAKQDLYRLKWIVDQSLNRCGSFGSVEDDWLREQEKKQVIEILSK